MKKPIFERKKVAHGDLEGKTWANLKNKSRGFSVLKSCSNMKAPFRNLIQEFKAVVFENDELEFRDMSELEALLPLLSYQDSNSDVEIIFCDA